MTPAFVASVTVKTRTDFPDDKQRGLVLRVTPAGVKTWAIRYRFHGQPKRYTIGRYDDLSLAQARTEARIKLGDAAKGTDPAAAKRQPTGHTFDALVRDYIALHAQPKKRGWKRDLWRLKRHVLPKWNGRLVTEITRRDVRQVVERASALGFNNEANQILSLLSMVFNFGIKRDWLEHNPASQIERPKLPPSRERLLTDDELRLFWKLCDTEPPLTAAFLKLRCLTAQRGGELLELTWDDVEEKRGRYTAIIIPGRLAKNGRAHYVPLGPTAAQILADLPKLTTRLFPGRGDEGGQRRYMDAAGRVADRMTTLAQQADPTAIVDVRGHDLRRTAATRMAQAGVPPVDISRVLNHKEAGPSATQIYQRYTFEKEKRIALEMWDRVLKGILEEQQDAKQPLPFVR